MSLIRAALAALLTLAPGCGLIGPRPERTLAAPDAARQDTRPKADEERSGGQVEPLKVAVDEFEDAVKRLDTDEWDTLPAAAAAAARACDLLADRFRAAREHAKAAREAAGKQRTEAEAAGRAYRLQAGDFRAVAGETVTSAWREHNLRLADLCDSAVRLAERRLSELNGRLAELAELESYLAEGEQAVRHTAAFFRFAAGMTPDADWRQFVGALKGVAERTGELLHTLDTFSGRLRDQPRHREAEAPGRYRR
jgi:hypothetical protein